ncbi:MAG: hypothetical protein Q9220_007436 [cf. Caloplaca sp. 1 TL-2023]
MVTVTEQAYDSWRTVYFQRTTVILAELLLVYALQQYTKQSPASAKQTSHAAALSLLLSPALLIIDHIHFQYNGFLYAVLILSLVAIRKQSSQLQGGLLFAVLLCLKHIYLYLAPAYFVYLLRVYCLTSQPSYRINFGKSIKLASGLSCVIGTVFGPFVYWKQSGQLLSRLFPFARGLCHAYWAPNIWAMYSFIDRTLLLVAPKFGFNIDQSAINSVTRGLVGDSSFACLPNISPQTTFLLTLGSQIPSLIKLFLQPSWESFVDASGEVDDAFPDVLKMPILRRVQFSTVSRLDHLVDNVYEDFKRDFCPGEHVIVTLEDGSRESGVLREKSKFPALPRSDGSIERPAYARHWVHLNSGLDEENVDTSRLVRERKTFTKQRLRSFLKKTIDHEAWAGAPWCVKTKVAEDYGISGNIPQHLTYEHQMMKRKANLALKKNEFDGQLVNFHPGLPQLKPKGQKHKKGGQDHIRLSEEYRRALAANPDFVKSPQAIQEQQIEQLLLHGSNGFIPTNGFHPIAAKGHPKPPPPPPPPKYPIEDLEVAPVRDKAPRPALKFLSHDAPTPPPISCQSESGLLMRSVGPLLETWDTLNVYCEVFQLDSFTFDDYVEALQLTHDTYHCQLLVEIHCAVLKKLVNDVNDKNGQVQFSLPEPALPNGDKISLVDSSTEATPTPEPENKPFSRTTRSSLAKSEAAELKNVQKTGQSSGMETRFHRAAEMEQSTRTYDWKTRLRRRDFRDGLWVYIICGLFYQLSSEARRRSVCDEILAKLAPVDQEPTIDTAVSRYPMLDINTRVKILEILCMLSLETKAIRTYMEDCNNNMTDFRKERIDMQRKRRAA